MRNTIVLAALLVSAGCTKLEDEAGGEPPISASTPAAQPASGERPGIIGKTTNQVVDLHEARAQNPNLKIVQQRAQGGDPISFALDAYVDVRSRVSVMGMQRDVQAHKALHDRFPTYEEFVETMRRHGIQFTMVEPYRMYAYDEKTGEIVVLEDPDEKRRRYEAAGIPVE